MEKTNKIDVNVFANAVKTMNAEGSDISGTHTDTWNGIEVTVKRTLSLKEMLTFVDNVVKTCFTETDGTYMPEVKDFAIKKYILEMYSNFVLPEDVEESYMLIYESDAVDFVLQRINGRQLGEIVQSAEEKIAHLAQANIEMVNRQMNDLYTAFNSLQNHIANVFTGIDAGDIDKLLGALSDGQIDEGKMYEAFLKGSKSESTETQSEGKVVPMPKSGE